MEVFYPLDVDHWVVFQPTLYLKSSKIQQTVQVEGAKPFQSAATPTGRGAEPGKFPFVVVAGSICKKCVCVWGGGLPPSLPWFRQCQRRAEPRRWTIRIYYMSNWLKLRRHARQMWRRRSNPVWRKWVNKVQICAAKQSSVANKRVMRSFPRNMQPVYRRWNYDTKSTLSASANLLQILAFCSSDICSAPTITSNNWEKHHISGNN